ncbi:MAG: hypothetical protein ABI276_01555 [Acidimicrobiales bacterium]
MSSVGGWGKNEVHAGAQFEVGDHLVGDTSRVAVELEFRPEYNSGPLWDVA